MSSNAGPIRILSVDDHPLICQGIAGLFAIQSDLARAQVVVWLVAIALGGCDRLHGDRTAPDAVPPGRYDTVTGKVSFFGQTLRSANLQVGHESWTFKDGAPPDVTCLAQTNDGFLWLCAPNGLLRFDGTRFEPFRSSFGDRLLSTNGYSLFVPPSGGLWVGYVLGGFSFLDNGRVTNYASETGSVYGFAQDRDGIVWAGASSGLWRFDHSSWQHIGVEWNAPAGAVRQIGFDSHGILWALVGTLGAPKDLIDLVPGIRRFKTVRRNLTVDAFTWDADRAVLTEPAASPMSDSGEGSDERPPVYPVLTKSPQFVDRNNSLWIITPADKPVVMRLPRERLHDAFNKVSPGGSETYDVNPFENAALVDREGNIWLGDTKGIHRFFYTPLIRQEFPKEASENADFAVVADDNGAVWSSSGTGFDKADLYYVLGGKAERRVLQVISSFAYRAPDKTFWFSGERCLWHLVGHDFVRVDLPPEIANQFNFLQTITGDQQGGMWVSFGRHGLYRLADGIWTSYGGRHDLPKSMLVAFTDSLGRVWFGYTKSQLAVLDGDRVRVFALSDGLQVGNILAIYGRGSEIWIGGELGLEQFDHGRFHNIAAVDDELLRGISGIVETPDGDLWLNGISGIFHIRKVEISEALKDSTYRVKGEHFGRREGLPGVANQLRPLPTAIEGTDGRLWFTLRNGVVWLDPADYSERRAVPPPITIQSVTADDKSYAPASGLSLPAHTSSVQISYSAVSLSDPEAIRFRYKLREADTDWHEVAASSPVTYRNLPPGSYHFNVGASDINGVWSDKIATAEFTLLPAFYQTLWFRSLCVILFLAAVAGLYQLRLRQLARQYGMRLEERVSERTRIARELHDTLLQSFHGLLLRFQTASELFPTRPAEAKQTLDSAIEQAAQAITEGRDAVQGLRSSTVVTNDLALAINTWGEELAGGETTPNAAEFHVGVEGTPRTLHPIVRDEIYRIACEALRNAFRHADATHIEVELRYDERQLRLRVRDDGKGIDPKFLTEEGRAGHYGLHGMRERAKLMGGKLTVWSALDSGAEVEVSIPADRAYATSASTWRSWFAKKFSRESVQSEP
jgi:signal transduction histidine kinase/ligand-binding sensor domain-containing protein